jgi:hypothetical protein
MARVGLVLRENGTKEFLSVVKILLSKLLYK